MGLRKVLLKHYASYPKMDIQDMVKLIYQNEFAGGHLITNEKASIEFLQREFATLRERDSLDRSLTRVPIFEEIGNGLCRLHLVPLKKASINLETVNKFFINTANCNSGTIAGFQEKLKIFKECCKEGFLTFPLDKVEGYLKSYQEAGYPPVRHSEIYRTNYCPAYRIIKTEYKNFFNIFAKIDTLLKTQDVTVAIDGNSGAGKSTLANLIAGVYQCNLFHMDDFFLTPDLKTEERSKEIGGNVDYKRFKEEVITGINSGEEFQYQVYDCKELALGKKITVHPKRLNIIEGSYSMHPVLRDNYDLKIFMEIDEKEQSRRILKRNGSTMHKIFLEKWIPLENIYFQELKIKENSDLVYSVP